MGVILTFLLVLCHVARVAILEDHLPPVFDLFVVLYPVVLCHACLFAFGFVFRRKQRFISLSSKSEKMAGQGTR